MRMNMSYRWAILSLGLLAGSVAESANKVVTVSQVTSDVVIADDVDYHITDSAPFSMTGSINITAVDHAVVVFDNVKPSRLLALLPHVRINGQEAVNNKTCQIKIYNQGAMILPYGSDLRPLTVYSGQNFTGEAVNDFGLESSGGFMNTLSDGKLNNKIRSFKLKRGYMVTFSTRAGGYGYSRCFIADTEDLEMAEMPAILDRSISSYRIFKWNDASKKGLANDTRSGSNDALNTTWCYSFGLGEDTGIDRECVAHHIYEGWPSVADCGRNGYTTSAPTMKTNNEPGNKADDHPQSVAEVLANWERLMATGLRLCSPSSHDGSLSWLKEFIDSVDARGWRCDVLDVHSYWPSGSFYGLQSWYNNYGRPLWISEWCWGASWNRNGAFNPSLSDDEARRQNADKVKELTELMNGYGYVERFSYWNSEAARSKLYVNGVLTGAGKNYAALPGVIGYNKRYEFIPKLPKSKGAPSDLSCRFSAADGVAVLSWHEPNGEYNKSMFVERRKKGAAWEPLAEVELKEGEADYRLEDTGAFDGAEYRIHVVYADGKDYFTAKSATAVPDRLVAGDALVIGGKTYYIGGNLLPNGNFDFGTYGWTNGEGRQLSWPDFEVMGKGGYDGGTYLQAYSHHSPDKAGAVNTVVDLEKGADYYFSVASYFNGMSVNKLSMTRDGVTEDSTVVGIPNNVVWSKYATAFNAGTYSKAIVSLAYLRSCAQFDQFMVSRLFASKDAAIADGLMAEANRARMLIDFNKTLPNLNAGVSSVLERTETIEAHLRALVAVVDNTIRAIQGKRKADSLAVLADAAISEGLDGSESLEASMAVLKQTSSAETYLSEVEKIEGVLSSCMPFNATTFIKYPSFEQQTADWVQSGSYAGGQQGVMTADGKKCWRAQWDGLGASESNDKSMAVSQTIVKDADGEYLSHGLYVLECKASTEHYCITDQHSYLLYKGDSIVSPALSADYMDIPTISGDGKWQTLTTPPVYVGDRDTLTIGFAATKANAIDNAWKPYGDNGGKGDMREGSWWATDFVLRHLPVYHYKTDGSGWFTLCLPYDAAPSRGVRFYQIAGITQDKSQICLEEIAGTPAGVPCVVYSDHADVVIYETGEKVARRTPGPNGLNGLFITSATTPENGLVLQNGEWVVQNSPNRDERAAIGNYSAYIKSLDNISELAAWSGVTLPVGMLVSSISNAKADGATPAYYSLDGVRYKDEPKSGVYLKVINGKAIKVVR